MQKRGFHPTFLLFEGICVAEKNLAYTGTGEEKRGAGICPPEAGKTAGFVGSKIKQPAMFLSRGK